MSDSRRKRAVIAALAVLVIVTFVVVTARPGPDIEYTGTEYQVTGFDMRVAVSKNNTYDVDEYISVDIPETVRAIRFAIPDDRFLLEDLTVEEVKAKAVSLSENRYVIIKDPELLTAGHHRYRIRYRLTEPADGNAGYDLFRFGVTPGGWEQHIDVLHVLMWFPPGFPVDEIRPYSEWNGDRDIRETVKPEPQSRSYTIELRDVPETYGLCLEAILPDGYWE